MTEEACEHIRLIGVIPVDTLTPGIEKTIRRIRDVHDQALLVYPDIIIDIIPDIIRDCASDGYGETVFAVQSPWNNRGTMLRTAAAEARRLNMTHILIHDLQCAVNQADIDHLITAAANHPDAVIIGHRQFLCRRLPAAQRIMRWGAAFMFRLQTGIELGDPGSPMRVYPLWIFDCLKIRTSRHTIDTEILVKAAWAGVPIHQVALETPFSQTHQRKSFFSNPGE